MALLFAFAGVVCLIAAGASLSYYRPGWALFFTLLSFAITGAGMAVKRKVQRK